MKKTLICYCFGYSEEEIIADVEKDRGVSTILRRLLGEKGKEHATAGSITLKASDASEMSAV